MSEANAVGLDWPQGIPVEELEVVYSRDMAKKDDGPATGLTGWVMRSLGVPGWGQLMFIALLALGGGMIAGISRLTRFKHQSES